MAFGAHFRQERNEKFMVTELIEQLQARDPALRREAASRLAESDARAIHPLVQALWDESPGVQEAAVNALGSFDSDAAVWAVLPLLREDAPRRNMALDILMRIGPRVVAPMAKLLNDKDADVRKFVVDVFGVVGGDDVTEPLLAALSDENANVRASGAKALGLLRTRESVSHLVGLLGDEEWVAFGALEALGRIADEESVTAITRLLEGPSPTLRSMGLPPRWCTAKYAFSRKGVKRVSG